MENPQEYLLWVFNNKGELLVSYKENVNVIEKTPKEFTFPKCK
jgi:hypothetical protein